MKKAEAAMHPWQEDHCGSVQDPESHVRDWREKFKYSLERGALKTRHS